MREAADPRLVVATLVVLAAILNLVEGAVEVSLGDSLVAQFPSAGVLAGYGAISILFAFVLFVLTIYYYLDPELHAALGTGMIVIAVFSLLVGGGFLVGFILALIGGIFAVALPHADAVDDLPPLEIARRYDLARQNDIARRAAQLAESPTKERTQPESTSKPVAYAYPFGEGKIVRYCPRCGGRNPLESTNCSACGMAMVGKAVGRAAAT